MYVNVQFGEALHTDLIVCDLCFKRLKMKGIAENVLVPSPGDAAARLQNDKRPLCQFFFFRNGILKMREVHLSSTEFGEKLFRVGL